MHYWTPPSGRMSTGGAEPHTKKKHHGSQPRMNSRLVEEPPDFAALPTPNCYRRGSPPSCSMTWSVDHVSEQKDPKILAMRLPHTKMLQTMIQASRRRRRAVTGRNLIRFRFRLVSIFNHTSGHGSCLLKALPDEEGQIRLRHGLMSQICQEVRWPY